jgi:hypothetical protein
MWLGVRNISHHPSATEPPPTTGIGSEATFPLTTGVFCADGIEDFIEGSDVSRCGVQRYTVALNVFDDLGLKFLVAFGGHTGEGKDLAIGIMNCVAQEDVGSVDCA